MNPLKAKSLYKETASSLQINEEDVTDLNNFYWKYIRKSMTNLVSPNIYLTGLGEFKIKKKNLFKSVDNFEKKLEFWKLGGENRPLFQQTKISLDRLKGIEDKLRVIIEGRKNLKQYRIENDI